MNNFLQAIKNNDLEAVKSSIANENINIADDWGDTGLHIAVRSGSTKIVELLIENGINQHIENNDEETALELALNAGRSTIVMMLINSYEKNFRLII